MATGFSDAQEAAILDDLFRTPGSGTTRSLYLYLFTWGGTAGQGNTATMADDGTRGTNLNLCTTGGFAPATCTSADFAAAVGGSPTSKSLTATKSWTASGTAFGEVSWWALSTVSGATIVSNATWDSNKASMIAHGPITNSSGVQTSVVVNAGETFQFDASNPIKLQLGDPSDTFA